MISAGYLLHPPPQRVRGAARVPHAAPPPATGATASTASEATRRAADADFGEKVPDFGQVQERQRRRRRQRRRGRGEKAREVQNPQDEPLMRRRGEGRQPTLQWFYRTVLEHEVCSIPTSQ